jgi:hypothetical protein
MDSIDPQALVGEIVFGRWKSQITHSAVELGLFEILSLDEPKTSLEVATEAKLDKFMVFRLMRAVAGLGLLTHTQDESKSNLEAEFSLTPAGALLREDHQQSMAGIVLLENGKHHYQAWRHLSDLVRDGKNSQDGFVREHGLPLFDFAQKDDAYGKIFNNAMKSFSHIQAQSVFDVALRNHDFSSTKTACDIGGGWGYLVSYFLRNNQHANGIVFDLPYTVENKEAHVAKELGVEDRIKYVGGDIFKRPLPAADTYFIKMVRVPGSPPTMDRLLTQSCDLVPDRSCMTGRMNKALKSSRTCMRQLQWGHGCSFVNILYQAPGKPA